MSSILERELVVITGKGGVGRSTVAAAIGLAAADPDRSTIVCETSGQASVPAILGHGAPPPGAIVGLGDGLAATTIDPDIALGEWISAQVGSTVSRVLGGSRSFNQFVAAAPGARELVTITKAWELGPGRNWRKGNPDHETVILDAPATGHGVAMLRAPGTFADIAGAGPIHKQARRVSELLADRSRSAIVAVTLPSELPVGETLDLSGWVGGTLGRGLDLVVVNRCEPSSFVSADLDRVRSAASDGAIPEAAIPLAASAVERRQRESELIDELAEAAGVIVEVPEFSAGLTRREVAEKVAATLTAAIG